MSQELERRKKEEHGRIIKTGESSVEEMINKLEKVNEYVETNEAILKDLRTACRDTLFFVEYDQVEQIRVMAVETNKLFFKPYYDLLLSVFNQLTNHMKKALETSERGKADAKSSAKK